jgi:hypothetical protein
MAYKSAIRNYDRVRNQRTRELWDELWGVASDALSKAYYDHWRYGNQFEVVLGDGVPNISIVDINPLWNQTEIIQFWDNLQKELHHCYYIGFDFWNQTGVPDDQIHKSEWDYIYEPDANGDPVWNGDTHTARAATTLSAMELADERQLTNYFNKWSSN